MYSCCFVLICFFLTVVLLVCVIVYLAIQLFSCHIINKIFYILCHCYQDRWRRCWVFGLALGAVSVHDAVLLSHCPENAEMLVRNVNLLHVGTSWRRHRHYLNTFLCLLVVVDLIVNATACKDLYSK